MIIAIPQTIIYFYLGCHTMMWFLVDSTSCVRTKFCLFGLPAPFFFYFQAIPLLKRQQNHSLTMSQEQVSGVIFVTIMITNKIILCLLSFNY